MNDNSVIVENKKIDEDKDNKDNKSKKQKSNQKDECIELKNIKYKSMLLNGVQKETEIKSNLFQVEEFLEKEMKTSTENIPWTKLEKATKLKKLMEFALVHSEKLKLNEDELDNLKTVLKEAIDRKHLQRVKDVTYDKEKCIIHEIPLLYFNENTRKFIIRRNDKKSNTIKTSLGPKRKSAKVKQKGRTTKTNKVKQLKVGKAKTSKEKKHNKTSKSPKTPKSPPPKK